MERNLMEVYEKRYAVYKSSIDYYDKIIQDSHSNKQEKRGAKFIKKMYIEQLRHLEYKMKEVMKNETEN